MIIKELNGKNPKVGKGCFFAETAVVIGDVEIGDQCSIWYNVVIRGDVNSIRIGNRVNIQDGAVVHVSMNTSPTNIGSNVSVGHNAIVHGCTLHDNVLVGMGSIVMDDCVVESNSIIAAGAVVTQGSYVEGNCIYAGVPARKIKDISMDPVADEIEKVAGRYVKYIDWYKK
ncbi:MAG: gamma carbonic anhydrase family protein [Desulfobulbaceae bacterium]|nr:gamma carbonic anhydrase family protein [Desulfobulbaceae bacterium]